MAISNLNSLALTFLDKFVHHVILLRFNHSCEFACQQRVLKTFPRLGYRCSEDGIV